MMLGIEKLDKILGGIKEGDVLLIETIGSLGVELLSGVIEDSIKKGKRVMMLLPRGASEKRVLPTGEAELLI